jgi:hypothetical protein
MEKNEIKKALYKENPIANIVSVTKDGINYATVINDNYSVYFRIPFNDIGDAKFEPHMDGKYLIRWIITE